MKNCKQATLFKPESGPKKSTPRKFAYISHFQWIGINATKFEKREFILKVTLSSVAVVDAKAPYYGESWHLRGSVQADVQTSQTGEKPCKYKAVFN